MPVALVVHVQALDSGTLTGGTGRAVHGLWFRLWRALDPALAHWLHNEADPPPFTLSPLMGLPRPRKGMVPVHLGQRAWFRITTLTDELSQALQGRWVGGLPDEVALAGVRWKVNGYTTSAQEHPWAGERSYAQFAREALVQFRPPRTWRLTFATPVTFHGRAGHVPFPLPESLVRSWLRRWQAFAPIAMPEDDLLTHVQHRMVVSAYRMRTVPVRYGERLMVGGVGTLKLLAQNWPPSHRSALQALASYAFYCGSGAKTTQGMGLTRQE